MEEVISCKVLGDTGFDVRGTMISAQSLQGRGPIGGAEMTARVNFIEGQLPPKRHQPHKAHFTFFP